jgi:hypothetical protein
MPILWLFARRDFLRRGIPHIKSVQVYSSPSACFWR